MENSDSGLHFTDRETERFYDQEDATYRSFWDHSGNLHWGYFEDLAVATPDRFPEACVRWSERMLKHSGIGPGSRVLDLGCGAGTTALWLAERTGCEVVGVDLSGVRIGVAQQAARARPDLRASFLKAAATDLPFPDGHFTHVWSQAVLYHVHDRSRALAELHRVLQEGGLLVFDDLTTPRQPLTELGETWVYRRLHFSPTWSHGAYREALRQAGFLTLEALELREHLRQSYAVLIDRARPAHPALAHAYVRMCEAIDAEQVSWSYFCCARVADRLSWIYQRDQWSVAARYDAWAADYDADLEQGYRRCPEAAAAALLEHLPDRGARVLDVGAGTGMVGEALARAGCPALVGADLSPGMLAKAAEKGVYQSLHVWDLLSPEAPWPPGAFDAIIATGVFTFNHADPAGVARLRPLLVEGGLLVLSFRQDFLAAHPDLEPSLDRAPWKRIAQRDFHIFDGEPMRLFVCRATGATGA